MNRFNFCCLLVCAGYSFAFNAHADEKNIHAIEEVLITGLPLQQTATESALPLHVLAGDALRENANATLGDTLAQLPGLRSASFGGGVGRPVIRGQSSTRVRVLQNGTATADVSAVSPDHANAIEPLLASQIEVIRGPATLLYGSGAIGGVVNVVDKRIPKTLEKNESIIEYRHNTVNHANVLVATTDQSQHNLAWHLDFSLRESEDVSIPGFSAVDPEAEENTFGYVANSDQQGSNIAGGFSWIEESARFGLSLSNLQNNYGIPPGVHEHEHEEGEEGEEEEEEHAEDIRLELEQQRLEFDGEFARSGWVEKLSLQGSYTDYQHAELAEHEEESTLFYREGYELRMNAHLRGSNKTVVGVQLQGNDFHSVGEEAYLPAVEQQAAGLFALYNLERDAWILESGLRVEYDELATSACEHTATNWSASIAGIYAWQDDRQWVLAYTHSARAPAMEELYSNIDATTCEVQAELRAHFATGLIEMGNPDLRDESSGNLELSFRKNAGDLRGELTFFYNQVSDYIFLDIEDNLTENATAIYEQQDASFSGLEASLTFPLFKWQDSHLDVSFAGDLVNAKFDDVEIGSAYLPRIPPARASVELAWWSQAAHLSLRLAENMKQDKLANGETLTPAYTLLELFAEYHWSNASVFLKLNNALDEEIRNHNSQIKDFVPEAGRGIEVGTRIYF